MVRKPKYRRHTTRDLAFVEHDKKRRYFPGPYGSQESLDAYRLFLQSHGFLALPMRDAAAGATLPVLCERFLAWAEATYGNGPRGYAANLEDSITLLAACVGPIPAASFTPLRLKEFQQWLVNRKYGKKKDRALSRKYINFVVANVRRVFKWAVSEELLPIEAYQALLTVSGLAKGRSGAKELPARKPVASKDVAATLKLLNPTVRAMVQVQLLTGVRSGSLCKARAGQFDCRKQPWKWRPRHKTEHLDHELVIFVGPKAQKIIGPLLKGKAPDDFIFQPKNKSGERSRRYRSFYDPDSYRQAVKRAAQKAGAPHWFPHLLRHTKATSVRERHGIEASQASLGHRKIETTQLYSDKQSALARKVARDMG